MATMGLSTGSLKRVRSLAKQWEATHGRKATPDVMQGLMEAELANATKGAHEAVRLEQNQEKIDFNKEQTLLAQEKADKANKVSGIVQTGMLLNETGAFKAAGKGFNAAKGFITGGKEVATAGAEALSTGVGATGVEAGLAIPTAEGAELAFGTGEAVTTGTSAAGGEAAGGGFSSVGAGIAALVLADAAWARSSHGEAFVDLKDRNKVNLTATEFGGLPVTPGMAAYFESHGVLSPEQTIEKYTGLDIGGPQENLMNWASDFIDEILPGVSDFFSDLGF